MAPTILCVDDERIVLDALREQLVRRFGSQVEIEVAESGDEALELLERLSEAGAPVPIVVSDQVMPGLCGDALLARVRARWPDTRTIMLTGQVSQEALGRALNEAALFRYFAKPWPPEAFARAIQEALEAYERDRALEAERDALRLMRDVAGDLGRRIGAAERYRRMLGATLSALDGRAALIGWRSGDALVGVTAVGVPGFVAGAPIDAAQQPLIYAALEASGPVRDATGVAAVLRLDGVVVGALQVERRSQLEVPDVRVEAFASITAAALRTARLIDRLERDARRREQLAHAMQAAARPAIEAALIGASAAMDRLRRRLDARAAEDDHVVFVGRRGAPLEALARALHHRSSRRERPFVVFDPRARDGLPLFGPVDEGSPPAAMDLAREGSLLLLHPDGLSAEDHERVARLTARPGGEVRVIGGLSLPAGRAPSPSALPFPPRLGSLPVSVPALRERIEDLPALVDHHLARLGASLGRPLEGLTAASQARLEAYAWPGDLAELVAVLERAASTQSGPRLDVDPSLLSEDSAFGPYSLVERLGEGGMGEVWRARHRSLARPAALKLIRPQVESARRQELHARFQREARATARLRSPNTVELYDFGVTEDGVFYYAMELLDGLDAHALVTRFGPMPVERAVAVVAQACRALGEAHEAGLVHRDIKPENLFLCRLGPERDVVKLLDFGMVTGPTDGTPLTVEGQVTGTPAYMAPEQILGGEVDARTDLYAVGGLLFWLLTGQLPFRATTLTAMLLAQVHEPAVAPSTLAEQSIPDELDALVVACLAKDPAARPASAAELWARLRAVPVPQEWTIERAERWWRDRGLDGPSPRP